MQNNSTTGLQNSGTETQLQQVLAHLHMHSLGEPTCQACNEQIREGDQITVYFHKPTDRATYRIGQCRCSIHSNNLTPLFTLGVSELIVEGRVGQCQDHATQQTWPVLLTPSIRLFSAPDTTSGRVVSDHEATYPNGHQQEQRTDCESDNPDSIDSCQLSPSLSDRDGSRETAMTKSTGRPNNE